MSAQTPDETYERYLKLAQSESERLALRVLDRLYCVLPEVFQSKNQTLVTQILTSDHHGNYPLTPKSHVLDLTLDQIKSELEQNGWVVSFKIGRICGEVFIRVKPGKPPKDL